MSDYIETARVPRSLDGRAFGAWRIERQFNQSSPSPIFGRFDSFAALWRGTCVVSDDSEGTLSGHLPFMNLPPSGDVLLTGLGLGCALRGMLAMPTVRRVTVIEICPDLVAVIGAEFTDNPRVEIIEADALIYATDRLFDVALHDVWSGMPGDELGASNAALIERFADNCRQQFEWIAPAKRNPVT